MYELFVFYPRSVNCVEELLHPCACDTRYPDRLDQPVSEHMPKPLGAGTTNLQVLVKFIQNETHAVHERIHICWLPLIVSRALMGS